MTENQQISRRGENTIKCINGENKPFFLKPQVCTLPSSLDLNNHMPLYTKQQKSEVRKKKYFSAHPLTKILV